ncbi:uncharacterized protein LOC143020092 [Oratosquilla oratoria]|uniref:uncharacterized protein LOC143020092 n=1 Tax=Oratosquilla oratoria TaxID=337810 RepID=UPI003F758C11
MDDFRPRRHRTNANVRIQLPETPLPPHYPPKTNQEARGVADPHGRARASGRFHHDREDGHRHRQRSHHHRHITQEEYDGWGIPDPPRLPITDIVAAAQVAAWRTAWESGASFVTLELVAETVGRSVDWVHQHWRTNARDLERYLDDQSSGYEQPRHSRRSRPSSPSSPKPFLGCLKQDCNDENTCK